MSKVEAVETTRASHRTGHDAVPNAKEKAESSWPLRLVAAILWLGVSLALAVWWLIFGLQQIDRLQESALPSGLSNSLAEDFARQHRMLLSEGTTFIILLVLGGVSLIYLIRIEILRARRIREFFAAFSHDLKTSLASVRLQAESLEEDLKDSGESRIARRLVKDTVRLEVQLENSLLLAAPEEEVQLLVESINLRPILEGLSHQWPDLEIAIEGDSSVLADHRALESILKNLLQNAVIHGRASKVTVDISRAGEWVTLLISDNGRGFKGDRARLGQMFDRLSSTSGSGLGLYLAKRLARSMRGELRFNDSGSGFSISLILPWAENE